MRLTDNDFFFLGHVVGTDETEGIGVKMICFESKIQLLGGGG